MTAVKPALIGGFVLGGLALGVAAILLFGSLRLFRPSLKAVVFFQGSVSGLVVGAPVTFRGVRIGSVQRILLRLDAKDLTARIPVYLDLQQDLVTMVNGNLPARHASFDRLLEAGLKAQLYTASFVTGQLQVDLDFRPDIKVAPVPTDQSVPEIPTIPSQLEALTDQVKALQLPQLVEHAQRSLASIQRVTDQLNDKIGPFIDSAKATSDSARDTLTVTAVAVRQVQAATTHTLGDIDQLAVLGRQQLTARGGELSRVLTEAERTMRQTATLTASLNDMTSPRSQTRTDLQSAIRDLAATASSLRNFSREVERNPSTILTGKGAP